MKRFLAALLLLVGLAGCGNTYAGSTVDFFAMDTFMSLSVYTQTEDQTAEQTFAAQAEQRVNALEPALSRTREDGDLYRLNHANGAVCEVSADTYAAIEAAVNFAELTDGAFDPTMAPLTDLWGIGTDDAHVPQQQEIDEALTHVGYEKIELLGNNQVRLLDGAQIDLGGIGKGFATDEVRKLLEARTEADGMSMLARLGGNIGAFGANPARESGKWVIGIADPDDSASFLATVEVENASVVTSGDYERFFEQDGKRYHHIFDPKTGYPAESGLRSVTVLDENSTRADALTTALFVMGLEKGLEFCEENNVAAVFITSDQQIVISGAAADCGFTFLGEERGYTYAQ